MLRDVKDEKVVVEKQKLSFSGVSDGKNYACEFELFEEVKVDATE